jgi:hypothetical protein
MAAVAVAAVGVDGGSPKPGIRVMKEQRPHPLQNKVDPWGELQALRMVGTLMGNRGILHDDKHRIVRRWADKRSVCCSLSETFQKRDPEDIHKSAACMHTAPRISGARLGG